MIAATSYTAVVVTFQRPDSLAVVLDGLLGQSAAPSLVVVADNDPLRSAEAVVHAVATRWPTVHYLPLDTNLGPAGGWARATTFATTRPERGEWLLVVDDDDPIGGPSVAAALLDVATVAAPDIAAVGRRGAEWHGATASLQRVRADGGEPRDCDYLASGGSPLYRWSALDEVGGFDESLFFGFEDLDLGLRLRAHGKRLQVVAVDAAEVNDTATTRTPWREYFKTRALVAIVRRHRGWWALAVTMVRSVLVGGAVLAVRQRRLALAAARWRGCIDGLLGRLGPIRYVPTSNPAKVTR